VGLLQKIFGKESKLASNIFAATPKRGQKLAKIGVGIAGFGASLEFAQPTLESLIVTEKYAFWITMAQYICYALGSLITLFGLSRTEENTNNNPEKNIQ